MYVFPWWYRRNVHFALRILKWWAMATVTVMTMIIVMMLIMMMNGRRWRMFHVCAWIPGNAIVRRATKYRAFHLSLTQLNISNHFIFMRFVVNLSCHIACSIFRLHALALVYLFYLLILFPFFALSFRFQLKEKMMKNDCLPLTSSTNGWYYFLSLLSENISYFTFSFEKLSC